jgi:predicted nuclease of predicted toxin-antitoxin system
VLVDRRYQVKLLLDEQLSPSVAQRLRKFESIDVVHIRDRGRLGSTDRDVLEFAFADDRILVTGNVTDFLRLASAREIHCGIVFLLDGALGRAQQEELLRRVCSLLAAEFASGRDMVNRILRVALGGMTEFVDMPPPLTDGAD